MGLVKHCKDPSDGRRKLYHLSERALHMRDDAFAQLGDHDLADRVVQGSAPEFVVDAVTPRTDTWTDSRGEEPSV